MQTGQPVTEPAGRVRIRRSAELQAVTIEWPAPYAHATSRAGAGRSQEIEQLDVLGLVTRSVYHPLATPFGTPSDRGARSGDEWLT